MNGSFPKMESMTVSNYDISVITCSINQDIALEKTLASINSQIDVRVESLVILSKKGDKLSHIDFFKSKVITQEPKGIYGAMNLGLKSAQGDYCIFLNAGDTFAEPNSLSKMFYALESHEWGYGGIKRISVDKLKSTSYVFKPYIGVLHCLGLKYVPHPATLLKTKTAKDFGGFDEKYKVAADQKLILQFARKYKPFVSREIMVIFALGGASSNRSWQSIVLDFKEIHSDIYGKGLIRRALVSPLWKIVSLLRFALRK